MFYNVTFLSWWLMISHTSCALRTVLFIINNHNGRTAQSSRLTVMMQHLMSLGSWGFYGSFYQTELQDGAVLMVTHLLIWRLITMLKFFSISDSEAVESNPSYESGFRLRYTLRLFSHLHHVLISGLAPWYFVVIILYALLISFHFCASFLSVAVPC